MNPQRASFPFLYLSERLCLDFVNTELMDGDERIEQLGTCDDLVSWAVGAGLLSRAQAHGLASKGSAKAEGERTLAEAVALRSALRAMAERIASGAARVPQRTLDAINHTLRIPAGSRAVVHTARGYEMAYRDRFSEPVHVLVPIAESAAGLLTSDDLALVRKCQNPQCILYFYDTTRNHARRWCSMAVCGNRAKVASHYRRVRQGRQNGEP